MLSSIRMLWYYFWVANFVVAGSAFVIITIIVLVRGIGDLRYMFATLRQSPEASPSPAPPESDPAA